MPSSVSVVCSRASVCGSATVAIAYAATSYPASSIAATIAAASSGSPVTVTVSPSRSTSTDSTPCSCETSPSIARWQCAQETPGTLYLRVVIGRSFSSRYRSKYPSRVYHMNRAGSLWGSAIQATLHCLTGCAIGEVLGMIIATALAWGNAASIGISVVLAFLFGYALTLRPMIAAGVPLRRASRLAVASDTLSILTMEIVDNAFILVVPGALAAGLADGLFWWSLALS